MRKKLFTALITAVAATFAGYNIYQSQKMGWIVRLKVFKAGASHKIWSLVLCETLTVEAMNYLIKEL